MIFLSLSYEYNPMESSDCSIPVKETRKLGDFDVFFKLSAPLGLESLSERPLLVFVGNSSLENIGNMDHNNPTTCFGDRKEMISMMKRRV